MDAIGGNLNSFSFFSGVGRSPFVSTAVDFPRRFYSHRSVQLFRLPRKLYLPNHQKLQRPRRPRRFGLVSNFDLVCFRGVRSDDGRQFEFEASQNRQLNLGRRQRADPARTQDRAEAVSCAAADRRIDH